MNLSRCLNQAERHRKSTSKLLKNFSESFDGRGTSGSQIEIIAKNPLMLSLSKHVPRFFSSLLVNYGGPMSFLVG
jgi:hypothetical protein